MAAITRSDAASLVREDRAGAKAPKKPPRGTKIRVRPPLTVRKQ